MRLMTLSVRKRVVTVSHSRSTHQLLSNPALEDQYSSRMLPALRSTNEGQGTRALQALTTQRTTSHSVKTQKTSKKAVPALSLCPSAKAILKTKTKLNFKVQENFSFKTKFNKEVQKIRFMCQMMTKNNQLKLV